MPLNLRERVSEVASDIRRRAQSDVRAGERAARERTRKARRRVRETSARDVAGRTADAIATDPDLDTSRPSTKEEVAQRAAKAAEAPAPIDASLEPVSRPDQVQHVAAAGIDQAGEMAMLGGAPADDGEEGASGMHAASEMAMLGSPAGEEAAEDAGQTPAEMATMGWGVEDGDDGGWF